MADATKQRLAAKEEEVITDLRRAPRIGISDVSTQGGRLSFLVHDPTQLDDAVERMRALVASGEVATIWPAHGPVLDEAGAVLDFYLAHRRERLDQVRAALERLEGQPEDELPRKVVEIVYADVDESLWDAAEWSVRAQLAYLAKRA